MFAYNRPFDACIVPSSAPNPSKFWKTIPSTKAFPLMMAYLGLYFLFFWRGPQRANFQPSSCLATFEALHNGCPHLLQRGDAEPKCHGHHFWGWCTRLDHLFRNFWSNQIAAEPTSGGFGRVGKLGSWDGGWSAGHFSNPVILGFKPGLRRDLQHWLPVWGGSRMPKGEFWWRFDSIDDAWIDLDCDKLFKNYWSWTGTYWKLLDFISPKE